MLAFVARSADEENSVAFRNEEAACVFLLVGHGCANGAHLRQCPPLVIDQVAGPLHHLLPALAILAQSCQCVFRHVPLR